MGCSAAIQADYATICAIFYSFLLGGRIGDKDQVEIAVIVPFLNTHAQAECEGRKRVRLFRSRDGYQAATVHGRYARDRRTIMTNRLFTVRRSVLQQGRQTSRRAPPRGQ